MIPFPAINRLCSLYRLLCDIQEAGVERISSAELGVKLGVGAHNIRKDIAFLGLSSSSGVGYDVCGLKKLISERFGFNVEKKACIVGLGRLGTAIMERKDLCGGEFRVIAGFDSNVNRLETIRSVVPLYPAHSITDVVRQLKIDLAIIAVPGAVAQDVADKLCDGGIKGILNFAPVIVKLDNKEIFIKNMDISGELRVLSAQMENLIR
ncbi:MAG: redox-sensing transcriptional repressor Rex [Fibrobacter sp.]|nr:redox-sensing transcriptional repressor Rex [Fibrobacter sp.]